MQRFVLGFAYAVALLGSCEIASAQETPCRPVSERTGEIGCWTLGNLPVGPAQVQTFWHLDTYPTRAAADAAKGPRGFTAEALGKVWLLTIEHAGWRAPAGGERVAEIGPLPVTTGLNYSANYMEAIFMPGMTSSTHDHNGPEAWYTQAGEMCLETAEGKQIGRAGGPPIIVPGGTPMHLTATGKEQRRALVLVLHESTKVPTRLVRDWTAKGLCKN